MLWTISEIGRNLFYTELTRSKTLALIVGSQKTIAVGDSATVSLVGLKQVQQQQSQDATPNSNEVATEGGKVIPETKTDQFIKAANMPVYVPLSGQTIQFNGLGEWASGCQ